MGRFNKSCVLISFHILLFFFFVDHIAASSSSQDLLVEPLKDDDLDPCAKVDCGQGKCVVSSGSLLGYNCVCNPGWNKMQLGPVIFPACTIPNCTINFGCGNGGPPPPPPAPANSPPFNLFNPCNIVWCGDGTCVANGLGYNCKCNEGSENLFNLTGVACFKECAFGADCEGVTFGTPLSSRPPPPGNAFGSPPNSSSPPKNASSIAQYYSTSLGQVTILLLCLIFLAYI